MTAHNEAKKEDIANIVIMPGDPNRVKYIAQNYLKDAVLVNSVRSNYAYTGYYNDTKITVMSSGMGMPSMAIYAYELFNFYDVSTIIRLGSCGALKKEIKLGSVIVAEHAHTISNFPYQFNKENIKKCSSSKNLNNKIINYANNNNIDIISDTVETSDVFYTEYDEEIMNYCCAVEMECFALFYIAKVLNKDASAVLTVSDNLITKEQMTSHEREKTFDKAISLVLKSLNK